VICAALIFRKTSSPGDHDMQNWELKFTEWIAFITVFTGLAQLAAPSLLLPFIAPSAQRTAWQLFATVGMFMALFGGMLVHALRSVQKYALHVVLPWSAAQKIGASVLVAWGVWQSVFLPIALLVAAFDLLSGIIFLDLHRRMRITQ
jgi:hypothetical protein